MARIVANTPHLPNTSHPTLSALYAFDNDLNRVLFTYLTDLAARANDSLQVDGSEPMEGDLDMGGFSINNVDNLEIDGLANGHVVHTGSGAYVARTLTGTANEITVTNGSGVSGNPTFSLPSALTFTGKTVTGGTFNSGAFNGTVGVTTPSTGIFSVLEVHAGSPSIELNDINSAGSATFAGLSLRDNADVRVFFFGKSSTGNADIALINDLTGGHLRFYTETTERLQITSAGVLNVMTGQVQFPATQNPSTDANTLDDYEENTFTPTLEGTTANGTPTYTTQNGFYVKIGQHVTVWFHLVVSALGGLTGQLKVGGMPFSRATANGQRAFLQIPFFGGITTPAGTPGIHGFYQDTGTTVRIYTPTSTGQTSILDTHVTGVVTIYGTMTYQAAA